MLKQRLYKRSRDVLIQLDMSERVQKLDETVSFVEEGYESLLQGFAAREEGLRIREEEAAKLAEESGSTAVLDETSDKPGGTLGIRDKRAKRKFTVEEEDEEENDEEGSGSEASKRPKV